jgi:hypothetical protein
MTRRTTVIQPSTTTDALYTLPNQPFKRRIVSASLYNYVQDLPATLQPELKIADVEGNVLFTAMPLFFDQTTTGGSNGNASFMFTEDASPQTQILYFPQTANAGAYFPCVIGTNLCVPASNLLTVTLWGSLPADTLPNLVLVTEDDDDEEDYRA